MIYRNALQILILGFFLISSFLLYFFFIFITILSILLIEVRWRDLKNRLEENLRWLWVWVEIMMIFFGLEVWLILNRGLIEGLTMRVIVRGQDKIIIIFWWLRWKVRLLDIFLSLHVKKWHIYCKKYDSDMCVLKYLLQWFLYVII